MRFKYILNLGSRFTDVSASTAAENSLTVILWSHVELSLALLATSLVALRPLLRHLSGFSSLGRSKESNNHQELHDSIEMPIMKIQSVSGAKASNHTRGPGRENNDGASQDCIIEDRSGVSWP